MIGTNRCQGMIISLLQWLFLVPVKGGRWHIIPQLAVYTFWGVICYLPPFTGTRNNHWLLVLLESKGTPLNATFPPKIAGLIVRDYEAHHDPLIMPLEGGGIGVGPLDSRNSRDSFNK